MRFRVGTAVTLLVATLLCPGGIAKGQMQFESEPINYLTAESNDAVAQLQRRIDAGEVELAFEKRHGYLPSVLQHLSIRDSSQMLVFSQTSFQLRKIAPRRPRAIYFNDDVYVGWVQNGDVVEVSAVDTQLGTVFYTLAQDPDTPPKFVRDKGQCTTCHASSRTQGVPGVLVRSVFPNRRGQPLLGSGTYTTDHRSPFKERWGGWYVTGRHGIMRHMGNSLCLDPKNPELLDTESGANCTDLSGFVDTAPYLQPTSDLVALMVLEHQSQMHNYLTLANFETRHALHYNQIMSEALERPADYLSDSTRRRIARAADKLVQYLFFSEEFELKSPIHGVSTFATEFASLGPKDSKGRSLRQFDLKRRLFAYPCSYLVYSPSFDGLPSAVLDEVCQRIGSVLSGEDTSGSYSHLSATDRQAIREILRDTKPQLAKYLD